MAATGLLGINPYQKGVAIDISSKPVNLAMQLEQKEAAKREALDKYFMDYEKTINPAGMRGQDQDVFLNKLGEAKQYYLQNRDKILNPAKYGADAQSEYMSRLKGAQSVISQSKQEAANEKVDREHWYQAQKEGLATPDGYLDAVSKSHLPLDHPQHESLDPYKWNFFKPFNDQAFVKDTYGNIKPNEEIISTKADPNAPGKSIQTYKYTLGGNEKNSVANRAMAHYDNDPGTKRYVDQLIKSGQFTNLENEYSQLFPKENILNANPKHIAAALALSLNDIERTKNKSVTDEEWLMRKHLENAIKLKASGKTPEEEPIHVFDGVGGGGREISKNYKDQPLTDGKNNYKIINGQVFDQNNKPVDRKLTFKDISGENFDKEFFDIINQHGGRATSNDLFNIETENGKIKIVKPENGANIDRKYAGELTNKFYKRKNVGKSNQEQVEIPNF